MAYNSNYTGKQFDRLKDLGFVSLSAQSALTMTLADTYYAIPGTFVDGGLSNMFTSNADGSMTYNGEDGAVRFDGTSDISIDATAPVDVIYVLYKNGSPLLETETPHGFTAQSKTENVSITGVLDIANGDTFQIYAKCDTAGKTLTTETLNVVVQGA